MLSQLRQFSLVLIFALALIPRQSLGQCGAAVDLNTWSQLGPAASGTWTVNAAGTQVVQSINGFPTFFVSPQSFINVVIKGTITTTAADDDFIGFVFGLQSPTLGTNTNAFNMQSYLFDWSRVPHSSPNPGRYLIEIDGPVDVTGNWNPWWYKTADPSFNYLAQTTGVGTGWLPNVVYDFELTYLSNRVIIEVNGVTFFDITGCFPPGRFGFYNFSQSPVTYSNFAYELLPDFTIGANNVCANDSASFIYLDNSCTGPLFTSALAGVRWDFGDGNGSTDLNPKHLYANPGTYTVKLVVTDNLGCQDSTTRVINIIATPPQPSILSTGGPLCEGQTLNIGANGGGLSYSWSGPNGFTSTQPSPTITNLTTAASGTYTVVTSNGTCSSPPASTNITVNPTPPTPNPTSNGPVCSGSNLNLNTNPQTGATYAWTGPGGFTSNLQNPTLTGAATSATGAYQVTTTVNGCPSATGQTNVVVNPIPNINVTGNTTICFGDVTTLTASGANTYAWNNGSTNAANAVSPSITTTYNVTGTSTAGCVSAPQPVTVSVNALPAVDLGPDTVVCDLYTLDAGAGGTGYNWNTGPTSQILNVTASGTYSVVVTNSANCTASDVVNVTIDVTPNVSVSGNTSICEGQSTTLTAAGGNSYLWSDGTTTASNTVTPPVGTTNYTVVGTSPLGCVGPQQPISVTVDPNPVVSLGPDTTVCDTFILDAGPNGTQSYLWSTGATSRNLTVTNSGNYSVTVTNTQGCFSVENINVTVFNTQAANLGPDQNVCPGLPVTLSPGTGTFATLNWSNGQTTPTISVDSSGTYSVNVVDNNGCPSSDDIQITVFPLLSGNIGNDTLICDGTTLALDAGVWGGAAYTWSPNGETTAQISPGTPGLYIVSIDDGNGCIYLDSLDLTVDVPPALSMAVSDSIQCDGTPVTFTVSPGILPNYNFAINGMSVQAGIGTSLITTALQNGDIVSVTGTTVSGCDVSINSPVSVNILPSPSGAVVIDTVCEGSATSLMVIPQGGNMITWAGSGGLSGNMTNISHLYPGPGTFPYTVTVGNGTCDTVITSAVEVRAVPATPTIQEMIACEGDDVILTSPGGGTVEWYDAPVGGGLLATGNDYPVGVVNPASSDSFYVQVTSQGCISARALSSLLVYQRPSADFMTEPDTNIILNIPRSDLRFMNLSSSATSYSWDFGDGFTSTAESPIHNYTTPGTYFVTLIATVGSGSGCQDTLVYGPYEVVDTDEFTAPNAFTPNGDGDNDTWIIDDLYFFPENKMTIFNRWGDSVFETEGYQNDWDGSWNGKPLPEGTYYYVIDLGEGFRLVKGFVTLYR